MMKRILPLLFLPLFFACDITVDDLDFLNQGEEDILEFIEENNLDAQKTASGIYYVIEEQGDGDPIQSDAKVTVAYKGYFLNGTVFDHKPEGITFGLNQVIPGWSEGIPLFNEGGKGMLIIPSSLGYGPSGYLDIPGGAVLVFDIEILKTNA